MSNFAYQNIPALSHSLIVECQRLGTLRAWRESAFNPDREKTQPTDALEQGQLYHCLIAHQEIVNDIDSFTTEMNICLKPTAKTPKDELLKIISVDDTTCIFVFDFGCSRKNKAYTEIVEYLQANNQWTDDAIVCNQTELDDTISRLKFLFVHPTYQMLNQYQCISTEKVIEFTLDDNPCKAQIDSLYKVDESHYLIVDWKTTRYSTREDIQMCGEYQGYHIQDYIYRNAVAAEFGIPVENVQMKFIFQNKEAPEVVYSAYFGEDSYKQGKDDFEIIGRDFMDRVNKYKTTGFVAFMDVCSDLKFTHRPNRFFEPPEAEFGL